MPGTKIINVLKDDRFEDILRLFQSATAQEVIFVLPPKSKFLNEEGHFTVLAAAAEEESKNISILSSNPKITELASQYNFSVLSNGKNNKKAPRAGVAVQSTEPDEADEEEDIDKEEEQIDNAVDPEDAGDFDSKPEDNELIAEPVYGSGREAETDTGSFVSQEITNEEEEAETVASDVAPDEGYQIVSAARINRTLDDIIKPKEEEKVSVRISKKVEKPLKVEVKKDLDSFVSPVPPAVEKLPVVEASPQTEAGIDDQIQSVWEGKKETWSEQTEKKSFKSPSRPVGAKIPGTMKFNFSKRMVTLFGVAAVILLGIVIYISTGSAQIIIKPRISPLDLNMQVGAADSYQDTDVELKRIPGQLFSIEKTVEESFPATGERDVVQKARGKITVYNEYGTTPQVLIATTRFESESGLIFRTLTTVTVPGTKVANGEITPGMIEVDVIADKAGDTYNVPAGKFTIPAFKEKGDADRYQKFYGISKEAMRGGIIGKAKVVTEQDYVAAKQKMEERIKTEAEEELKQQTAGLKILTPAQPEVQEITSNAQVDEAIDNFTLTAKAKIQTVGFKESDLFLLISMYIEKANDLMIVPEKLKLTFESVQFNKEGSSLSFVVLVQGPAYAKIDQDKIVGDLLGKNKEEITAYIKGMESIVSARVILSPPWVRKVPMNKEKVKLTLDYE